MGKAYQKNKKLSQALLQKAFLDKDEQQRKKKNELVEISHQMNKMMKKKNWQNNKQHKRELKKMERRENKVQNEQ